MKKYLLAFAGMLVAITALAGQGRYLDRDVFLHSAFPQTEPQQGMIWITKDVRDSVEAVLGHHFSLMRVRYWYDGATTAWILDEIGKEEPITIGVSIEGNAVGMVRVLEFRESRGWEVRYPFFTDQFNGAKLHENHSIDKQIDSITGATMSVGAVRRIVQTALILHEETGVRDAQEIRTASTL